MSVVSISRSFMRLSARISSACVLLALCICSPFVRDRLSCRNQPDHLVASFVTIGIGHHQNRAKYHSNRLPSLLSIDNAILNAERPGIVEYRLGSLEADLVLCE